MSDLKNANAKLVRISVGLVELDKLLDTLWRSEEEEVRLSTIKKADDVIAELQRVILDKQPMPEVEGRRDDALSPTDGCREDADE